MLAIGFITRYRPVGCFKTNTGIMTLQYGFKVGHRKLTASGDILITADSTAILSGEAVGVAISGLLAIGGTVANVTASGWTRAFLIEPGEA